MELVDALNLKISLIIIIVIFFTRSLIASLILEIWKLITRKDFKVKEHPLYGTIKNFLSFISIVLAMKKITFNERIQDYWIEAYNIIIILFITKLLTLLINKDFKIIQKTIATSKSETVNLFICKIVRAIIWLISIFIIIRKLGYDLTGLVAGLGLGSIVISLAAQDTVKSLLSGVAIFTDKPFEIGDWVKIGEFQGNVVDITFRSTRVKSYDNSIITIPNFVVTSEYVINWNKLKSRRFDCVLTLDKETNIEKTKKLISQIKLVLREHPKVKKDTVEVFFDDICSYSNDIKIFLYVNEISYLKFSKIKEELYFILLDLLEKENIELAFPTQTVQVKEIGNIQK